MEGLGPMRQSYVLIRPRLGSWKYSLNDNSNSSNDMIIDAKNKLHQSQLQQ